MHVQKLVRKTLSVKDHRVVSVKAIDGSLRVELEVIRRRRLPCNCCGERRKVRDRLWFRVWQHVPLWGIPVTLRYRPCRVSCPACGVVVEAIPWSQGKSRLTVALIVMLATWTRLLAVDVVARLFGVHWNTVYTATKAAVEHGLSTRRKGTALHIGIDEISRRKGHIYHTQVYDLDRKVLLWSGEGRTEETLRRFFDEYGKANLAQVTAVCCDMWEPYTKVIAELLPDALLVFDKFHLIRHLHKAVDEVRRQEAAHHRKKGITLLKGERYLFLKNPENLTDKQQQTLSFLTRFNLDITKAWLLKEEFRLVWLCETGKQAQRFLHNWFRKVGYSRLEPLKKFANMVKNHIDGILAWFETKLSNGIAEALNNTAKAISRRSRGFRTAEAYSTVLMHCMGGLQLPHTVHKFL